MTKPILYSSWSSACPNRVIIALALKKINYEYRSVNNQTEEEEKDFLLDNPAGKVPVLKINGLILTESLAIIEYLDEIYPEQPLLPKDPAQRAHVRAIAHHICTNIQPLQNKAIKNMLNDKVEGYGMEFCQHHIKYGFDALEKLLETHSGKFSVGDQVTIADLVLPSMVYNAINKYPVDMTPYATIRRIAKNLSEIPEFQSAQPERQPDAPRAKIHIKEHEILHLNSDESGILNKGHSLPYRS